MSVAEIVAKFGENAAGVLSPARIERLVETVLDLDQAPDVRPIVDLAVAG